MLKFLCIIRRRLRAFILVTALMAFALSCQGDDGEVKPVGQILYETNCQSCHGGASGGRIDEIPPRHNANGHTWHHPDQQLNQIINGGFKVSDERGQMPAFGEKLTMQEIRQILEFIKTWWSEDQRSYQATVTADWRE